MNYFVIKVSNSLIGYTIAACVILCNIFFLSQGGVTIITPVTTCIRPCITMSTAPSPPVKNFNVVFAVIKLHLIFFIVLTLFCNLNDFILLCLLAFISLF